MNTRIHSFSPSLILVALLFASVQLTGCVMGPDAQQDQSESDPGESYEGEAQALLSADECQDDGQQVCGADGLTYASRCDALANGTSVLSVGACVFDGCTDDDQCGADQFCKRDTCDARAGRCAHRPVVCLFTVESVCGCNGQTYENACVASADGASVDSAAACQ